MAAAIVKAIVSLMLYCVAMLLLEIMLLSDTYLSKCHRLCFIVIVCGYSYDVDSRSHDLSKHVSVFNLNHNFILYMYFSLSVEYVELRQ